MPAPRVLFVKLSSLGDVVHHMPAVTEFRAQMPHAHVAWAVEEAYAPLVRLHPGVSQVIPVALRALRGDLRDASRWQALRAARHTLRASPWDYAVDAQGLLKSAFVARSAGAQVVAGPGFGSARENAAALFYGRRVQVPREMHAVDRNRVLVAGVFGYRVEGAARYGLQAPASRPAWAPAGRYAVLLHAASREAKRWPEASWIAVGSQLAASGCVPVLPGGNEAEREAAGRIARAIPGAIAAPAMDLAEASSLLAHADRVAGVDTGLTHLAVAFARPTVGIYRATRPTLTGLHGEHATNLGGPREDPTVEAVVRALGLAPRS